MQKYDQYNDIMNDRPQELANSSSADQLVVPDGITPYVGFRVWNYRWGNTYEDNVPTRHHDQRGMLRSLTAPVSWSQEGVTVASCEPTGWMRNRIKEQPCEGPHPNDECPYKCGLHAYHTVAELRSHYKQMYATDSQMRIVGAVLGWGDMVRHKDEGWRAQYAKPVAFLIPQLRGTSTRERIYNRFVSEMEEICELLGAVRCRDYDDLQQFGFDKGARWIDRPILP